MMLQFLLCLKGRAEFILWWLFKRVVNVYVLFGKPHLVFLFGEEKDKCLEHVRVNLQLVVSRRETTFLKLLFSFGEESLEKLFKLVINNEYSVTAYGQASL